LIGIGIRLGGTPPSAPPNIEDVLYFGLLEALAVPDYRLLALLVDWLLIHGEAVNVDRLTRLVAHVEVPLVRAFWGAIGQWLSKKDTRWKKTAQFAAPKRADLFESGTDFLITKHGGEDSRFQGTCIRIPAGTLRHRPDDILPPEALAARHPGYYFRLVIGPTYRADMWAFLEREPSAPAADVARFAYGSFTSAWGVKKDFERIARARILEKKRA
jgi:hypothetical protein